MTRIQFLRALACAAVVSAALFTSSHAMAGVSNPDPDFINITRGAILYLPAGGGRVTDITGQIEGDLAADGTFDYAGSRSMPAAPP